MFSVTERIEKMFLSSTLRSAVSYAVGLLYICCNLIIHEVVEGIAYELSFKAALTSVQGHEANALTANNEA